MTYEDSGVRVEFLPPYSPDYNPIELTFSAMKDRLRRNGAYLRMAMTDLGVDEVHSCLMQALYETSQEDYYGWYHHCGYI